MRALRYKHYRSLIDFLGLFVFVLVGAYLRLHDLSTYYFNFDDVWNLGIADESTFLGVIKSNYLNNVHPPLFLILLHAMLAISRNEMFLRCVSILPSLFLIPLFFYMGLRFIGRVAAYAMGLTVALGVGPILLSTVIRPYSWLLVLLGLGLWCALLYRENPRIKTLWFYFIPMSLAVFLNYSAAIFAAAVGMLLLVTMITHQKIKSHMTSFIAIHTILLCIVSAEYLISIHFSPYLNSSVIQQRLYMGYIYGFDLTLATFFQNLILNIKYWSPGLLFYPFMLLLPAIVSYQICRKKYCYYMLFIGAILINVMLSSLAIYPFVHGRWCVYLLPFFLLIIGDVTQDLSNNKLWVTSLALLLMVAVMFGEALSMVSVPRSTYARFNWDFFIERKDYNNILNHLMANYKSKDVVLIEKQMAWYFLFDKSHVDQLREISPAFYSMRYRGLPVYYYNPRGFLEDSWKSTETMSRLFSDIKKLNIPINNAWFVGISCPRDFILKIIQQEDSQPLTLKNKVKHYAENIYMSHATPAIGITYSVKWDKLR